MISRTSRLRTAAVLLASVLILLAGPADSAAQSNNSPINISLALGLQRGLGGGDFEVSIGPSAEVVVSVAYAKTRPHRRVALALSMTGHECLNLGVPCGTFPAFFGVGVLYGRRLSLTTRTSLEAQLGPAYFVSNNNESEGEFGHNRFGFIARVEAAVRLRGQLHVVIVPRIAAFPPTGPRRLGAASLSVGLRY
jgi:hypothetical protein